MGNPVNQDRAALEEAADIGKRAANKRIKKGLGTPEAVSDAARKEKATADLREHQAARAKVALEKEQGKLIERSKCVKDGEWLATVAMAQWDVFAASWPTELAGLSELQIREYVLKERERYFCAIRAEIEKL